MMESGGSNTIDMMESKEINQAHRLAGKATVRSPNGKCIGRSEVLRSLRQGDGVAQLVERRTQDSMTRGSNHVRCTRKTCDNCSKSKMLC